MCFDNRNRIVAEVPLRSLLSEDSAGARLSDMIMSSTPEKEKEIPIQLVEC